MSSNAARGVVRAALAVGAALLLTRLWFVAHRALDLDEFEHAHAAWSFARGLLPYRDFFEHHPPLIYLLSAPLFAAPETATDASAAARALMFARGAMWLVTVLSAAIVYRLGVLLRDRVAGACAVVLLTTSSQFLESMLEFRPDVPAVFCLLTTAWCLAGIDGTDNPRRRPVRVLAGGVAFGAALLFTQKAIFAAPGLGVAFLLRRRVVFPGLFAAGVLLPVAVVAWWFNSRGALAPLWYYTVTFAGELNADRFSPFPRLVSNVVQQPAIYILGIAAMTVRLKPGTTATTVRLKPDTTSTTVRLKPDTTEEAVSRRAAIAHTAVVSGFSRTVITLTALSLIAGIFIIGKAYDQYYALLLPLLAALGGAFAASALDAVHARISGTAAAIVTLAVFSLVISARRFTPIDPQLDEIAFITTQTKPSDSYVGGSPGAALFRPHGWYYFFLTGPFASATDYTDLLTALETDRIRPRLLVRDRYLDQRAPAMILEYFAAHYRHVRGDLYLRQSEYGSASLNTSEASDRFDRPFTR
ncbi:MAG TPA: glycosyltransferase family 39 protein [Vicinamibacterales bacterium]|nr:glycosyltransferase family 39 protein [Vicinamibacterales bacterium]